MCKVGHQKIWDKLGLCLQYTSSPFDATKSYTLGLQYIQSGPFKDWVKIAATGEEKVNRKSVESALNHKTIAQQTCHLNKQYVSNELTSYLVKAERHRRQSHRHCWVGSVHCRFQKLNPGVRILGPI